MQIISNAVIKDAAVTIGAFDGIHKGHKALISSTVDFAKKNGLSSCVFTFKNNPSKSKLITANSSRFELLAELGVDFVSLWDFNESFKKLEPREFFNQYLKNASYISVGFNFCFGKDRAGDVRVLKTLAEENNIPCFIVPPVELDGVTVSSSEIRKAVCVGNFALAEKMLDRPYLIHGTVQMGDQIGRKIGFPTANIKIEEYMLLPAEGVYETRTYYNGNIYPSITNYGGKPTIREGVNRIETHIPDFNENIYGKEISLRFVKKIRDIKTFSTVDELKAQIQIDTQQKK